MLAGMLSLQPVSLLLCTACSRIGSFDIGTRDCIEMVVMDTYLSMHWKSTPGL